MENNINNRERFFAQYYLQEVLFKPNVGNIDDYQNGKLTLICNKYCESKGIDFQIEESHLVLKPLSSITYEDRYWLCNQMAYRVDEKNFKKISDATLNHLFEFNKWSGTTIINITDYLRSKGYALPYMGLSVETLVQYGWIKLNV